MGDETLYAEIRVVLETENEPGTPAPGGSVREPEPTIPPAEPSEHAEAPLRGTILLVEDDAAVRGLLGRVLRKAGFDVVDAVDGVDALEKWRLRAGPVDLVVTDVVMPRMAGPELVRRLRMEAPALRVLYVSGFTFGAALTDRADFMAKPLQPAELVTRIRALLTEVRPSQT